MMGGKDFVVQRLKWPSSAGSVICRWEAPAPPYPGWRGKALGPGCMFPEEAGAQLLLPPLPCRFKESIQTLGHVDAQGQVHCVSPLLYESGRIPFNISPDNGRSFPYAGTWLAGEPRPRLGEPCPRLQPGPTGTFPSDNPCTPRVLPTCCSG